MIPSLTSNQPLKRGGLKFGSKNPPLFASSTMRRQSAIANSKSLKNPCAAVVVRTQSVLKSVLDAFTPL